MTDKQEILTILRDEYNHWETLLASFSEAQIIAPELHDGWSLKDVMAHLRAWQQRTIARLEAALNHHNPQFPKWPEDLNPEQDDVDALNAWIYQTNRDKAWSTVYDEWRSGFRRVIELTEAIPEKDLLEPGKYSWLGDEPLALILTGTCEHHQEHEGYLEPFLPRLHQLEQS